ncbi:glutaredoxin 2 [Larsenimonas salina]|uniref:glutaredoxin 2 n=1 Tax=Larsenimonas salina TaxID=1295565 RepID=UPI002073D27E|nr:glutaredoxin 2 [Larsenimonas salina]MCM5705690.1 glutaredoxin 2 [Larsenimonas salina]
MKLYVYDHCPFCVKARMIFGLKDVPFELEILLNDDEETPRRMTGVKSLPILERDDGSFLGESQDIIEEIDRTHGAPVLDGPRNPELARWLKATSDTVLALVIPRVPQAPFGEFATPEARAYFTEKKEAAFGRFDELRDQTSTHLIDLERWLNELEPMIQSTEAVNGVLSQDDIELFATLRQLSLVEGVQYPARVDAYRHAMAKLAQVPLNDEFAL